MNCPYCRSEIAKDALVCATCSRDIAVPEALVAERAELLRKRNHLREELRLAQEEVEAVIRRRRSR